MPIGKRIPYPPCEPASCTGDRCAGAFPPDAKKYTWPELVGVKADVAKATIERENPYVTVVIPGAILFDICLNRVYLHIDHNTGIVIAPPPHVG